jgi:amidase
MMIFGSMATVLAVTIALAISGARAKNKAILPVLSLTPPMQPLIETTGAVDLFPMPLCGEFKLEEATIDDMQKAMQGET